jgi:2-octaprenyl-6-methoxyphenol hydroxylase
VHPLAGQGLNLGIGDAEALAQVLLAAHDNGADVGSLHTLREYERRQQPHNLAMMGGVDALRRIFDWQVDGRLLPGSLTAGQKHSLWSPMIVGRNAGLALLNGVPALKRLLADVAMGA